MKVSENGRVRGEPQDKRVRGEMEDDRVRGEPQDDRVRGDMEDERVRGEPQDDRVRGKPNLEDGEFGVQGKPEDDNSFREELEDSIAGDDVPAADDTEKESGERQVSRHLHDKYRAVSNTCTFTCTYIYMYLVLLTLGTHVQRGLQYLS